MSRAPIPAALLPPVYPFESVPLAHFAKLTGVSAAAVRQRISRLQWLEGQEFCRDPTGAIHILIKGYDQWAKKGASLPAGSASRLRGITAANDTEGR